MLTVSQLVNRPQRPQFQVVDVDDSVSSVLQTMFNHGLGAVFVMKARHMVGIFSERDYARIRLTLGESVHKTRVGEVMRTRMNYVDPDFTLNECMALMVTKKIGQLPVMAEGKLLTLISIGEVTDALIDDQAFQLSLLTQYITGSLFEVGENPLLKKVRELTWSPIEETELDDLSFRPSNGNGKDFFSAIET